ncbi:regucalcin-like [Bacillus rossius redtenbacheri]|uniref:regucalcin-like n=1 Tax=Bacillus rossius redtenbacheri TaxID=93214 RepID=UPI002FDE5DC7
MVHVEPVGQPTTLGEGPHWDEKEQVLYFVDIVKGTVNKYDPTTKRQTSVKVDGGHASLVVPVEGRRDQFVITMGRSLAVMTWDGESSTPTKVDTLCTLHGADDERENKFNDGKVDPTGRFWAGTHGKFSELKNLETDGVKGSLFSFSKDWKPSTRLTDISVSNGLAWSPDLKTMYYIDTLTRGVDAFDFNSQTGDMSHRRVVFDFRKNNMVDSYPDGMTIDTEGKLWVACFNSGQVIRVDPNSGELLSTVSVPSPQITSVTFGGPNLDELYITSGNFNLTEDVLGKYPHAGYTFRVTGVGAKGYPGRNVQLA